MLRLKFLCRRVVSSLRNRTGMERRMFLRNQTRLSRAIREGVQLVDAMPGVNVPMVIRDDMFLRSAYTDERFERDSVALINDTVKRGDTVVDVGANVGVFSMLFSSLVGPGGKVVAFEPGDFACNLLMRNKQINNFEKLQVVKAGLGEVEGEAAFYSGNPGMEVYNSLKTPYYVEQNISKFKIVTIPVMRGDTWCQQHCIERIDFLKIDVEGGELGVLRGFDTFLRERRIGTVLLELTHRFSKAFGYQPSDVTSMLRDYGYRWCKLGAFGELTRLEGDTSDEEPLYVATLAHPFFRRGGTCPKQTLLWT